MVLFHTQSRARLALRPPSFVGAFSPPDRYSSTLRGSKAEESPPPGTCRTLRVSGTGERQRSWTGKPVQDGEAVMPRAKYRS